MTLLTEIGHLAFQHGRMNGTMRVVTGGAVFSHRSMLPNQRASFFLMAGVTGAVHRRFFQHARTQPTMGIMATGAVHLAFAQGHMRRTVHFSSLVLMALKADFFRIFEGEHEFIAAFFHDIVAVRATDAVHFMGASTPVQPGALLVALQANAIFILRRESFKGDHCRKFLVGVFGGGLHMLSYVDFWCMS